MKGPQTMMTRVTLVAVLAAVALVARRLLFARRRATRATIVTASGEPLAAEPLLTDVDASIAPERR